MTWLAIWIGFTAGMATDPLVLILALIVGVAAQRWWHLVLAALTSGLFLGGIAFATNADARGDPFFAMRLIAIATAVVVIGGAIFVARALIKRRRPPSHPPHPAPPDG